MHASAERQRLNEQALKAQIAELETKYMEAKSDKETAEAAVQQLEKKLL